jgi:hypothetical protein
MHEPVMGARYTDGQGIFEMGALAEAVIAAFDPNTEITWTTEGLAEVIASFTQGPAKVKTTFLKITEADWRVGFEVIPERPATNEVMESSMRILSGVFHTVREFLEVRQPIRVVFAGKSDSLGELYETYLKREDTSLAKMGYEMEPVVESAPFAELAIRKSMPSAWRS